MVRSNINCEDDRFRFLSSVASATFLLTFVPMVFLTLALILMLITMILVGSYLRRNEYEDYDIKLPNDIRRTLTKPPDTFNLYRLEDVFQKHPGMNIKREEGKFI